MGGRRLRSPVLGIVLLMLMVSSWTVPVARGEVVQELVIPSTTTLNVGYGYSTQAAATFSLRLRNTGAQQVNISSIQSTDPMAGYVESTPPSGPFPSLAPAGQAADRWTFTVRVDAFSNQGATDTSTPVIVTITHSEGTLTVSLPLQVRDWRQAAVDIAASQTVTHPMPCPATFDSSRVDFTVRVTNTGDYTLNVVSLSLYVSEIRDVQSLSSTPFTVSPNSGVDRQFRISVPNDAQERTYSGTVSARSSSTSDQGTFSLIVQHPVEVVMPTQTLRHDFGEVELMRPPENPWSHLVEERCGYKDGVVTLETPLPPGFVLVDPSPLRIPEGGSSLLRIIPRFNSSHANLLLTPQDFQVKFRTNGATNPAVAYDFRATPSFINVQEIRSRLQELAQNSPSAEGKEVARRTLELVENRTVDRRPTTPEELEDAGRIVGLAEPVILGVEQFETVEALNQQGRQEQAVQSLSVLAAGLESLRSVCDGVIFVPDRTECLEIITLLETTLARFAEESRRHFEGLTGGGLTELGELRAAESLALLLEALGDEEGAATFEARAQQHFLNFTARLDAADQHVENIERRETFLTPAGFLATDLGYVAWHPFGLLFIDSFAAYANAETEAARTELRRAGEENRLRDLEAEAAETRSDLATGRVLSWAVTIAYGLVLLVAGIQLSSAWVRRRSDKRLVSRGDVVLGKAPPLV